VLFRSVKKNPTKEKSHTQGGVCVSDLLCGSVLRLNLVGVCGGGGGVWVALLAVLWCLVLFVLFVGWVWGVARWFCFLYGCCMTCVLQVVGCGCRQVVGGLLSKGHPL